MVQRHRRPSIAMPDGTGGFRAGQPVLDRELAAAPGVLQAAAHLVPRIERSGLDRGAVPERAAKGFACWTQFVAMTFCQLAHADCQRQPACWQS